MLKAIWTVLLADFTMSLDNVLGVAGAAGHHYHLLVFGLVLSIVLMAVAANLISDWIKKNKRHIDSQVEKKEKLPEIDRKVARKFLCKRIAELAQAHSFNYNRISIRKQKSYENRINIILLKKL